MMPLGFSSAAPAISVVVPACNAATYVRQAVESVLTQTHDDLEVVVVDDGSTDGTHEALRTLADPRLRVLAQNRSGPSAARNHGCRAARASKYIAFLDADDYWDSDKLQRQVAFLESRPDVGAVGSLLRYVCSTGRTVGCSGQEITPADQERIARGELCPFPAMSTLVVRRDLVEKIGGFDEALGRIGSEDLDFIARLAEAGPLATVPAVLGSYRVHPQSTMARHRRRVSTAARFVRARQTARRAGGDLTWDAFAARRATWTERHQDAVESCYRAAAVWHAEGRIAKAFGYGLIAAALNPRYTLIRLCRQLAPWLTGRTERAGS